MARENVLRVGQRLFKPCLAVVEGEMRSGWRRDVSLGETIQCFFFITHGIHSSGFGYAYCVMKERW